MEIKRITIANISYKKRKKKTLMFHLILFLTVCYGNIKLGSRQKCKSETAQIDIINGRCAKTVYLTEYN